MRNTKVRKGKKAYAKPVLVSQTIYEQAALGCGKLPSRRTFQCQANKRFS
jgi:hypothetical protein